MDEMKQEWAVCCMRLADGTTQHDLWVYDFSGREWFVATFRIFPSGEQVAAALAMWKVESRG